MCPIGGHFLIIVFSLLGDFLFLSKSGETMATERLYGTALLNNFANNNFFHEVDVTQNLENAELLKEFVREQVENWQSCKRFRKILEGYRYYSNKNDILRQKRLVFGKKGEKLEAKNLANNRLAHGFLRKLVEQKIGYLLSKPFIISTKDDNINDYLQEYLTSKFYREFKKSAQDAIVSGFGWLLAFYDENGNLSFKSIPSIEIIPFWHEGSDLELDLAIRMFKVSQIVGTQVTEIIKVSCFTNNGIFNYIIDETGEFRVDDQNPQETLFQSSDDGNSSNVFWNKIPIIQLRYTENGERLLSYVKPLIDDYDKKTSELSNVLEEEPDKIKVVKNYDGTDLGEFVYNLAQYRTVLLRDNGDVQTLDTSVTVEALEAHLERLRRDIFEFGAGIDTQDKNLGNSSGVALKFLYADLDMDMRNFGMQLTNSLEYLTKFIFDDINRTFHAAYDGQIDVIFNTDIAINETETIDNLKNSVGLISEETIVKNHPYVNDPVREMELMQKEKDEESDELEQSLNYSRPNAQNASNETEETSEDQSNTGENEQV
jgi:SPP1 family phage portal protein